MPLKTSHFATALCFTCALLVAACTNPPQQNRFAEITFEHHPDIKLDVSEVVVEQAYVPPNGSPNVDHLFPVKPVDAAIRWAGDRLVVAGTRRTAKFIVKEASVVEVPLDTKKGLQGTLTNEQSERYDAKIVVELQILDGGRTEGTTVAEAVRRVTVPEDITLNDRERVWYRLTEDIMSDLNKELEKVIRTVYFPYLVT